MHLDFDVWLAHNRKDTVTVHLFAEAMQAYGIDVWLDDWEKCGSPHPSDETLREMQAICALVGRDGDGPWHDEFLNKCLARCVNQGLQVIPILLPSAGAPPELPAFLRSFSWVDFRKGVTDDGLYRLAWRIGGTSAIDASHEVHVSHSDLRVGGEYLFGRHDELRQLDVAWDDDQIRRVIVHARTGTGKMTLANHWISRLAADGYRGATRVFGWTFYSQVSSRERGSVQSFFDASLMWFGAETGWDGRPGSGKRLAKYICDQRTLLVLDAVELVLRSPDDEREWEANDELRELWRELATGHSGMCVLLSSQPPAQLVDSDDLGTMELRLDRLSRDAGVVLLAQMGVEGSDDELQLSVDELEGHALGIALMGSYLVNACKGNIASRRGIPDGKSGMTSDYQLKNILRAFFDWFGERPSAQLLRLLSIVDGPADPVSIAKLQAPPTIRGINDYWSGPESGPRDSVSAELEECGLVTTANDGQYEMLDMHALIRRYVREQIRSVFPGSWESARERLLGKRANSGQ